MSTPMDDPNLEAIRQQALAGGGGMGGMDPESQAKQQEQKAAMEEQRSTMLQQVMAPQARERLMRISLVKPEKARKVEDMILQMATRGQIGEMVSEKQLISWLEKINDGTAAGSGSTKIIQKRRNLMDDDDW